MKQAQDTYTQLLRADKLLNRNKYNEVLSITKKILKIDNKNADALSLAGLCYERQANKWRDKGKKQLAQQYYRKALPYFEKQTKVDSKDAVAWYNRGTILSKLDNYNAAIKIAKQALELLPKDEKAKFIGVFYDIGDGYFEIKKYKRVIETDNFVLRYTPKDVDVLVQKGGALCNIGKYKPALVAVNKALKSERNNVHAMENKAIILSKLGRNKEALLYFNRVLKIEPDRKNTLINKLLTLEDIDRFDKKLWAKVIDIEPYFYDEIKRIVKKLITEGKHREALLYLNLAIKKACERGDKELVSLLSDRGICLLNLFRFKEALKAYNGALKIALNDLSAMDGKVLTLVSMGRAKEAYPLLKKIRVRPNDYVLKIAKAAVLLDIGKFKQALEILTLALKYLDRANPFYELGLKVKALGLSELSKETYIPEILDRLLEINKQNRKFCLQLKKKISN